MPPSKAISKIVSAAIVIVIIVAALGGYAASSVNKSAMTQTTTMTKTSDVTTISTVTTSSYSTITYVPLQVKVSLNATSITPDEAIFAQISIINPLNENFTVVPSYSQNSTIANWNWNFDFNCYNNAISSLAGYALFSGYYSSNNISSAGMPLNTDVSVDINPSANCFIAPRPDMLVFLPNSTSAVGYYALSYVPSSTNTTNTTLSVTTFTKTINMTLNVTTVYCGSVSNIGHTCFAGNALVGYWNFTNFQGTLSWENATFSSQYFHHFSPGEYTLVVEDMWGRTSYSYFQVVGGLPTNASLPAT